MANYGTALAIRIGQVNEPMLVAQQIGLTRRVTVAATSYLCNRSEPKVPEDLAKHNCIIYTRLVTGNEWHFHQITGGTIQVIVNGNLQVDSSSATREAVMSGIGIAICPVWLFGKLLTSDSLQVVLTEYEPIPLPISCCLSTGSVCFCKSPVLD